MKANINVIVGAMLGSEKHYIDLNTNVFVNIMTGRRLC